MNEFQAGLASQLRDPVDDASLSRTWQGVVRARRGSVRVRRSGATLAVGFVTGILTLAGIGLVKARHSASARPSVARPLARRGEPASSGLRLSAGGDLASAALGAPSAAPREIALSDGSRIALAPEARLEPLVNDGGVFRARLRTGRAHFEVVPGGPRRWTIDCANVAVEVVGTGFWVEHQGSVVRVEVDHGVVVVRGETVPDGVRTLVAGATLVVPEGTGTRLAVARPTGNVAESRPRSNDPAARPVSVGSERTPGGSRASGPVVPSEGSAEAARHDFDGLIARADELRRHGESEASANLLETALAEFPREPRAGVAAFTLGRIEADVLRRHERAATAFDRAVELGVPTTLLDDALARRAEERARAGNAPGASGAAGEYLARFPRGAYAERMRVLAAGSSGR